MAGDEMSQRLLSEYRERSKTMSAQEVYLQAMIDGHSVTEAIVLLQGLYGYSLVECHLIADGVDGDKPRKG